MANLEAAQALAGVPLFAGMSKRHINSVAKLVRTVEHKRGAEVAAEGRGALAFHVVAAGSANVQIGGVPRRVLRPGDYFGEISMIDGQPRTATVTAGEDGLTTYALNRMQFLDLVDNDKDFARAVMVALCGRIRAERL